VAGRRKNMKKLERILYLIIISGLSFVFGVFFTFYEIDQRVWNEELLKARDIETRYINYKQKKCYKKSDLDLIILGEIQ
tara:strand:- start:907 stop:1143 length:237 start_codon:yes stop_codon:yes gene_type:complete